jgi:hypothetical protein
VRTYIYRDECSYMYGCMDIYVCIVFLNKKTSLILNEIRCKVQCAEFLSVLSFSNFIGNGSMYCLICASKQSVLHFQLISKNQPMQINVSYEDGGV